MTPDQDEQHATFALEIGPKSLHFYEQVFDILYPLPKVDMVAIPDFAPGAMENWGLVLYWLANILDDTKSASLVSKHRVVEVITHELAH